MKTHIASKNTWTTFIPFVLGVSMLVLSCTLTSVYQPSTPTSATTPAFTATSTVPPSPTQSPTPAYDVGSTIVSVSDGMKIMFVPAGDFLMGNQDGADDEKPVHSVHLDAFWIDQTEVTNGMYALCVKHGFCNPPFETYFYDDPEFVDGPVDYVTWDDANAYCTWAGRRLPTEAEWEKAASWDNTQKEKRVYAWGNAADCSFANIYIEGNDCAGYPVKTGSYPLGVSYYGTLDMTGNVTEWVADFYDETYYQVSPSSNPKGPERGTYHALRGGSFLNSDLEARTTARFSESFFNSWATFYDMVGFRCATNDPNEKPSNIGPSGFLDKQKLIIVRKEAQRHDDLLQQTCLAVGKSA